MQPTSPSPHDTHWSTHQARIHSTIRRYTFTQHTGILYMSAYTKQSHTSGLYRLPGCTFDTQLQKHHLISERHPSSFLSVIAVEGHLDTQWKSLTWHEICVLLLFWLPFHVKNNIAIVHITNINTHFEEKKVKPFLRIKLWLLYMATPRFF